MDGIHDLGGMQGFGPVAVEQDEPVFHEAWEATARALTAAVIGAAGVSGGEFRNSIERMDPAHYLTSSYYEHWLTAAATLAVEHGIVSAQDLESRAQGPFPLSRPSRHEPIGDPGPDRSEPRFGIGDRVRVRQWHPFGHTRCPRYVRGEIGVVVRRDKAASVPDIEAHSDRRRIEPIYCVGFEASELWQDGQPGNVVHVDLWDSYLEPAP
jgi:nitrile hydratase beta subunit